MQIDFAQLHVKGSPLLLYNAWDVGSAKAIASAGAKAIATSSWAVAVAQGYKDGEDFPLDSVYALARRIVDAVDVPVTVDFEGGYSESEEGVAANVEQLIATGIAGINFEDRVVSGDGLYTIDAQARRIAAIRDAAERKGAPLFINARTDLFLGRGSPNHADSMSEAIERASAYAAAGASGFFVAGLTDEALIARVCEQVELPVNVMMRPGLPSLERLAKSGVARVSYGSSAYDEAMAGLERAAKEVFSIKVRTLTAD